MPSNNTPRQRSTARQSIRLDRSGGANQADAAGADINKLVATFRKNGTLPAVRMLNPLYGDFTFPEDPHSVFQAVAEARDRFDDLPASVRTAAGNQPEIFLEMFQNPDGLAELVEAGLQVVDEPSSTPAPAAPPAPAPLASTPPAPADPPPAPTPEPST